MAGITLHLDIESFSSADLSQTGVTKYAAAEDFNILLCAFAIDDGPVRVLDLNVEADKVFFLLGFREMLLDPRYTKSAYNASFEIACLTRYFNLQPELFERMLNSFNCTMAQAAYCSLPIGLGSTGTALGLPEDKKKMAIGRRLIDVFCKPSKKALAGVRVPPAQEPEKWQLFMDYCAQDVEAERAIQRALAAHPMPAEELALWRHTCRMNALGVEVDLDLVQGALALTEAENGRLRSEGQALGMDNPNSLPQLKAAVNEALAGQEEITVLRKADVEALMEKYPDNERLQALLGNRQAGGKSSLAKYPAIMAAQVDGRIHDITMYYGASRTGRFAGRGVQPQNLPRNYLENLDLARSLVKQNHIEGLRLLFGDVQDTLSQLIRTAIIPAPGRCFLVADFSAIEARVIAWLAGEQWVMDEFAGEGKIYEATAAQMFGVPLEKIKHGNPEYAFRQKGKVATLACIAEGQLVLTERGLIPIEKVGTDDRVWDGENWVAHDGVVFNGVKEVMEYGELCATPDHLVWIEGESEPVQLRDASSRGAHIVQTGYGRTPIRVGENHKPRETLGRQMGTLQGTDSLHRLWPGAVVELICAFPRKIKRVPGMLTTAANPKMAGPPAHCSKAAVRKPERPALPQVRRKGDPFRIPIRFGCGVMATGKCPEHAEGIRTGPDRQQRKLFTRESSLRPNGTQQGQPSSNRTFSMGSKILALCQKRCYPNAGTWKDATGNHQVRGARCVGETQELAGNSKEARVYDIRNAGPNNRFTVSGRLAHNCGYAGSTGALTAMGSLRMGLTEDELPEIVARWRTANPHIVQLWADVEEAALTCVQEGCITQVGRYLTFSPEDVAGTPAMTVKLPSGRKLYYLNPQVFAGGKFNQPSLHYLDAMSGGKQQMTPTFGGKLSENIIQAIARDCLASTLMRLESAGYCTVMHIHDECVIEAPADVPLQPVLDIMSLPVPWAPGLVLRGAGFKTTEYYMKD